MELASLLPQDQGILPLWLLLVSAIAAANSVQSYLTTSYIARVYTTNPAPVSPLHARTFGTYTFISALIRFYGAYHITEPAVYQLCIWTYLVAWAHFTSEWFYFRTAKWGEGLAGPVIVSNVSLVWMLWYWGDYVQ